MKILSLLLLSLLPLERPTLMIADYVDQQVDCVPRYYAGQTRVMCDLAPATQRAVDACIALTTSWTGDAGLGCNLDGPNGLFYWGSTVSVCGTPHIDLHGAKFLPLAGATMFRFEGFGQCDAQGRLRSMRPSLRGFYARPWTTTSSTADAPAIEIHSPVTVEQAHLQYFSQGVRITANATDAIVANRANANSWILRDVIVQSSLHAGVYVDGPDVNVGIGVSVKSTSNCTRGTSMTAGGYGQCADIMDGSFLGCTWDAPSTGYAKDTLTLAVFPGIVLGDSANSRSVCVGCYIEGGYGGGIVAGTANVLGGIGSWTGGGNRLEGNRISGLEAFGSDGTLSLKIGSLTGGGALTLTPTQPNGASLAGVYPLRFKYAASTAQIRANVGNVGSGDSVAIGVSSGNGTIPASLGGLGGLLLAPNSTTENVFINHSNRVASGQTP